MFNTQLLSRFSFHSFSKRTLAMLGLVACLGTTAFLAAAPAHPQPKKPVANQQVKQPIIRLNHEQIARIMQFLRRTQPDVYLKAMTLRLSHPKKFVRLISEAAPNFRWLEHLQKTDTKLFNLTLQDLADTHKSFQIVGELRQPGLPNPEAHKLRKELVDVVTNQFDVQQKIRTHELNRLLRRINTLRADLKERQQKRASIITKRVNSLIGRPPSLIW